MNSEESSFPSTHWSLVKVAQQGSETEVRQAMETICQRYWYPIYAYLRHSGHAPPDAEDLTQGFFHRLISEKALLAASEGRGRLRSYLLGVLKHHLSDQKRHNEALKRGGGLKIVSFDETVAEQRYALEPRDLNSPDKLFDRAWAVSVLTDATAKLREAFLEGDNEEGFRHLSEFLPMGDNDTPYRDIANRMGVNEKAVRLQVHRMRQRYRRIIEDEVRQTVADPAEIQEELDHLMAMMS
ncbi:MAG: DNA-directed RNA polymerase specialized sigma24 family protein [Verrucomicrobiales bacterium]|jgi:DNA-directed RNA polymerase specialized sigma24 family protein